MSCDECGDSLISDDRFYSAGAWCHKCLEKAKDRIEELENNNDLWASLVYDLGSLLHQEFQVDKDTIGTMRSAILEDVEKAIDKEKRALIKSCKKSTKHW